jgi:peptidoglycan/xylan/chitin deacetylase (PgdA/CDA1 family)
MPSRLILGLCGVSWLVVACGGGGALVAVKQTPIVQAPESPTSGATPSAATTPTKTPSPVGVIGGSGGCISVPILEYHYIRAENNPKDPLGERLSVAPLVFQAQMDWLKEAGGHTVTLAAVMAASQRGPRLPAHAVVLTFDDGYSDFATAAVPVLVGDGFVATSFVVPGFLGRSSYMTSAQVLGVAATGMVIGAHTMNHVDLAAVNAGSAWFQIEQSKLFLESLVGRAVPDFAYPYGDFNAQVVGQLQRAGFRDAVTELGGDRQCFGGRYALPRTEVIGGYSLARFAAIAGIKAPPVGWVDPGSGG